MARFSATVKNWARQAEDALEKIVKTTEIELFSRIVMRSPVDTGRFRSNWNVDRRTDHFDIETAEITIGRMIEDVQASRVGAVTSYINALPYSERLEFGHSKQAPQGVVRVTELEAQAVVDAAAAKHRV